jgi:hypothetical protein
MKRNIEGAEEKVLFKAEGVFDTTIKLIQRYHPEAAHVYTHLIEIESTISNEMRSRYALFFSYRDAWEMFTTVVQVFSLNITQVPPEIGNENELY